MKRLTYPCFLILLLLTCGLKCNTDVARVMLPETDRDTRTARRRGCVPLRDGSNPRHKRTGAFPHPERCL